MRPINSYDNLPFYLIYAAGALGVAACLASVFAMKNYEKNHPQDSNQNVQLERVHQGNLIRTLDEGDKK